MAPPLLVSNLAHPCPALVRRALIAGLTLGTVLSISSQQPPSLLLGLLLCTQIALALVLCGPGQPSTGRLSHDGHKAWQWQSGLAPVQPVKVEIEFDLGWLLCLRLMPSNSQDVPCRFPLQRQASRWVWLQARDPESWLDMRLRLNGIVSIQRRNS